MPHFHRSLYDRRMPSRPRILLVHGSVANGDQTWAAQRALEDRFEVVVPNRRGFPPGPEVESVDYEDEARWLDGWIEPGTHLVGHSYGGVIALYAAAWSAERVRSLTVIEPPAHGLVEDGSTDEFIRRSEELWEQGPRDPAEFLRAFMTAIGARAPADPSPELLQGARLLMVERYPWRATPPLDEIRAPALVVSGGHSPAFDAVCDLLEQRLHAQRAVLPGRGHSPQLLGEPFNELLAAFVEQIEAAAR
jgi:pimeloyl-ACP methyl ester carboxylesterase